MELSYVSPYFVPSQTPYSWLSNIPNQQTYNIKVWNTYRMTSKFEIYWISRLVDHIHGKRHLKIHQMIRESYLVRIRINLSFFKYIFSCLSDQWTHPVSVSGIGSLIYYVDHSFKSFYFKIARVLLQLLSSEAWQIRHFGRFYRCYTKFIFIFKVKEIHVKWTIFVENKVAFPARLWASVWCVSCI